MARVRTIAVLLALSATSATAQPAPPTSGPSPTAAPPAGAPPTPTPVPAQPAAPPPVAAPPEEAPPVQVIAPPPIATPPPIDDEDVTPAPPPKATVAAKPTEAAIKRARYDVAVIHALDKIAAESIRFEAAVGRPVRYKNLVFTVKACERSAGDEAVEDSMAYMTVESQPRSAPGKPTPPPRQTFRGWMYASSPGLHPLQHPVYDAWLITCRAAAPVPVAAR
ncbi:DUF2155 domain-containing protein [Phenylobacterium sp.]|uniref:DUF2155 domain-containing protein n=1 Tax=Phenylobacterium sp. TaxID=1871053 RepID=UPI00272FE909|nr:DUF2155 domain-containing protein [Phenylobacterium sp.]MDP1598274.1 DUF2155 domain-containing protein [Phenylobacterium sp.]MDP3592188.1 DUF2155 domain-containing protein [Phenylobacterium sp.]